MLLLPSLPVVCVSAAQLRHPVIWVIDWSGGHQPSTPCHHTAHCSTLHTPPYYLHSSSTGSTNCSEPEPQQRQLCPPGRRRGSDRESLTRWEPWCGAGPGAAGPADAQLSQGTQPAPGLLTAGLPGLILHSTARHCKARLAYWLHPALLGRHRPGPRYLPARSNSRKAPL